MAVNVSPGINIKIHVTSDTDGLATKEYVAEQVSEKGLPDGGTDGQVVGRVGDKTQWIDPPRGGAEVDPTLTQGGAAADAKAVGDKISHLTEEIVVKPADYNVAVLTLDGDCTGMTKDDYVTLAYTFQGRSGAVQVKKQGSSSIDVGVAIGGPFDTDVGGLFNFTLKFPEAFEAKTGWGEENKYHFKAHAIDFSQLRNVGGAKMWGRVVKSRKLYSTVYPTISGGTFENYYTYKDGVYTAPYAVSAGKGRYAINGFTLPPAGSYLIVFDAFVPDGNADLSVRATCFSETANEHYAQSVTATGEWQQLGIGINTSNLTGELRLGIQAQNANNFQFKNVRIQNRDTGEIIPLPPPAWQIKDLPNGGAVDGFPCVLILNGKYYMLGTFNIPKDGWMYGMHGYGYGEQREAILCAEGSDACYLTETATVGTDFELEYATDKDNAEWVQESLNALVNACVNSDGTDLDTTVAQYLDWDSAIDMMAFLALIGGFDLKKKNYTLATYDGKKWIMGAYDMDSIFGNWWTGQEFFSATHNATDISRLTEHRIYYLIRHYKLAEFKARYAELRAGVLSEANVEYTLNNFAAGFPLVLMDANAKRWPRLRSTSVNNLAQILNWYRMRCQIVDAEVNALT